MVSTREGAVMTAEVLLSRLRRHYIEPSRRLPGGIFVPEVGMNGGYGAGRRCDAVYVGFTTTSGRQLIGHEVKVSRSDWVSELGRKSGKADAWADQCHQWWLVVSDPAIVRDGELPEGWGLMSPGRSVTRMAIHRPATPKVDHQPSWDAVRSVFARYDTLRAEVLDAGRAAAKVTARAEAKEESDKALARRIAELPDASELQARLALVQDMLGAPIDWTSEAKHLREVLGEPLDAVGAHRRLTGAAVAAMVVADDPHRGPVPAHQVVDLTAPAHLRQAQPVQEDHGVRRASRPVVTHCKHHTVICGDTDLSSLTGLHTVTVHGHTSLHRCLHTRCRAVDLIADSPGGLHSDQRGRQVCNVLAACEVTGSVTLVGHSMGGLAAYWVNVRYVRGESLSPCDERPVAMRSSYCYWGGWDLLEGGFTVRRIGHPGGWQSYWIFTPSGELHRPSLEVLTRFGPSTQETYAYSLVDHLNWLHVNRKATGTVTLDDLRRYMNGLTGQADGVYGVPWRAPEQKPLGASAAANVAAIVKVYYLALAAKGQASAELADGFEAAPRTTKRRGSRQVSSNPLAPRKSARRPRFLADSVVAALFEPSVLTTARDLMIVTWLRDGGLRVGGMCGLRFCDLHLTDAHPCGQRADPHVHIVGRDDNPNRARAKAYAPAGLSVDGYVLDGVIRAVSPAMISTFYGYLLDEYHAIAHLIDHEQVLVHVQGSSPGRALSTSAVRKMLRRSCERAGLNARITPHAFRHRAAAALHAATDFNAEMVAQEFGWTSPSMVTELYGKSANREAMKHLHRVWETAPGLSGGTSGSGAQS
ncbi:hypothetical protein BH09ACT8_BH09ACT8_55980 [soil metagenome]